MEGEGKNRGEVVKVGETIRVGVGNALVSVFVR